FSADMFSVVIHNIQTLTFPLCKGVFSQRLHDPLGEEMWTLYINIVKPMIDQYLVAVQRADVKVLVGYKSVISDLLVPYFSSFIPKDKYGFLYPFHLGVK